MVRKIKIEIGSVSTVVILLDQEAPKTCDKIWQALPLKGNLMHGIASGREVFLPLFERLEIPPENQTIYPVEGDLVYYYKPYNYLDLEIPLVSRDIEVISLVYGRDTQMFGPVLPLPVNHFGVLESGQKDLVNEISSMRRCGFGAVSITKLKF